MCKNLGVGYSTFSVYKNDYIELQEVLKSGKEDADAQVESALFKRAIGYEFEEVKTYLDNTGADKGKGNAGIAAGGLDDDGILLYQSFRFGIEYHGDPYSVLDAAGGIEELKLGHHLSRYAFSYPVQPDQWRVADELRGVAGNAPGELWYLD